MLAGLDHRGRCGHHGSLWPPWTPYLAVAIVAAVVAVVAAVIAAIVTMDAAIVTMAVVAAVAAVVDRNCRCR